jgi:SAM-dependent methyltransferase
MKEPSDYTASTTAYYNAHSAEYCKNTVAVNMSELYAPFLDLVPAGGRILDAGCGSGRDSLAFLRAGYDVVSIDASQEMVKATSKLTGRDASLLTFDEMEFNNEFDGIWACASLLHVSRRDQDGVLGRMTDALKLKGVLYVSFKHGDVERLEHGRLFNDMNEPLLETVLVKHPRLHLLKVWISEDVRNERRGGQKWLNAIVCRSGYRS